MQISQTMIVKNEERHIVQALSWGKDIISFGRMIFQKQKTLRLSIARVTGLLSLMLMNMSEKRMYISFRESQKKLTAKAMTVSVLPSWNLMMKVKSSVAVLQSAFLRIKQIYATTAVSMSSCQTKQNTMLHRKSRSIIPAIVLRNKKENPPIEI